MNNELSEIFKHNAKKLKVYLAQTSVTDPYENSKETTMLPPIPIKALVSDLIFSKIQWSMPGIKTDKAKEIIVNKKHRTLLEKSYKIKVHGENNFYNGWKKNSQMQIREEGNSYIRLYIYIKKD